MIGPQFKLTGLSVIGISTELQSNIHDNEDDECNANLLEPVLYIVHLVACYRVDVQGCLRKVFENEAEIEMF